MENHTITATTRTVSGKQVSKMRREGKIPAVLYGHNKETQMITLDGKSFEKIFAATGSTSLVTLAIEGGSSQKVLVHDTQYNAIRRELLHVDFYAVNLREKLRVSIPIVFTGVSDAVDTLGGTLLTIKDEVEVECLPDALISQLTIDLSALATFDDTLRISNLTIPKGVVLIDDKEDIIASVAQPKSEEDLDLDSDVSDSSSTVASETSSGTDTPAEEPEKKA